MGEPPLLNHYAGNRLDDHLSTHPPQPDHRASPDQVNGDEEDYTIKCICGFSDDDGHTTLCEHCNTWQHVECYYHHTNLQVPEIHKCVDCSPQQYLDPQGAAYRQRIKRDPANDERKAKRSGAKGHRKSRTKDLSSIAANHVNGWSRHDSPDGVGSKSPHDHAPPHKRVKTHHRDSGTGPAIFVDTNGVDSRHTPDILPLRPPVRPPLAECPPNYFSADFIHAHREDPTFQLVQPGEPNEFHTEVIRELGTWLDDADAFAAATKGKEYSEVLQRYGGEPWKDHQPPVHKDVRKDTSAVFHGAHPIWTSLVANRPIQKEELVGELIGEIGTRENYFKDPDNQWDRLRHPDHFVFFHPQLPIYIDCRSRGSLLRHVRRGCSSNVKLCTFIEDDRHWRFAFTSTREIQEGEEIVVEWSMVDPTLLECLKAFRLEQPLNPEHSDYITSWSSNVLAHYGGCACENQLNAQCAIGKFDRRLEQLQSRGDRPLNNNKHRGNHHVKPEANNHNRDWNHPLSPNHDSHNENEDAVSSSRSSPSATSRDQTPTINGNSGRSNGLGVEPSEREKKKMQQQARLIEKMDREAQKAQRKKRRSGSNPNTPIAPNPKSFLPSRPSASNSNTPASLAKASRAKSGSYVNGVNGQPPSKPHSESQAKTTPRITPTAPTRPKPVYVDAGVQTSPIDQEKNHGVQPVRRPYKPLSQRLLRRNHLLRAAQIQPPAAGPSPAHDEPCLLPPNEAIGSEPYTKDSTDSETKMDLDSEPTKISADEDHPMTSGDDNTIPPPPPPPPLSPPLPPPPITKEEPPGETSTQASHRPPEPPPPPWDPEPPETETKPTTPDSPIDSAVGPPLHNPHRPTNLHVDLPPPQFSPNSSTDPAPSTTTSTTVTNNVSSGTITGTVVQSPSGSANSPQFAAPVAPMSAPLLTPTTPSLAQPSPAKKKISLADYSKRRASQAQTPGVENKPMLEQSRGNSSPSAISDGPGTPSASSVSASVARKSEEPEVTKELEMDS